MRANSVFALQFSLMIGAVLFGVAAVVVVNVPALNARADLLLPLVVMAGLVLTPFTAWWLAPRLGRRF